MLYRIPQLIVGENETFQGPEEYVVSKGVTTLMMNNAECIQLMREFIEQNPELWNEDIGEID